MSYANRRTSLPAIFHGARGGLSANSNNNLSPKLGFLKEISEFDIDPPFLSPASSSSSADTSPMLLSPTTRPASARLYRRRRKLSKSSCNEQNFAQSQHSTNQSSEFSWDDADNRKCGNQNRSPENEEEEEDGNEADEYFGGAGRNSDDEEMFGGGRVRGTLSTTAVASSSLRGSPDCCESGSESPTARQRNKLRNNILSRVYENRKKYSNSAESPRSLREYSHSAGRRAATADNDDEEETNAEMNMDDDEEVDSADDFAAEEEADDQFGPSVESRQLERLLRRRSRRLAKGGSAQQLRSFHVDSSGRLLDSGFHSMSGGAGKIFKPSVPRSNKSRRATCPEIWLSTAEDDESREATKCVLEIFGSPTVGKKSVARQLFGSADVVPMNDLVSIASEDLQRAAKTVSFLMNENEIEMEIKLGRRVEAPPLVDTLDAALKIYIVVYSVDNRESFTKAAKIMYRLYEHRVKSSIPLILVANKIDLQRRRRVSAMEGKMLSKIYKCAFVETSALLSMNVDGLWRETLKKLQKHKLARERALESGSFEGSGGATVYAKISVGGDTSAARRTPSRRFVGRILNGTRRFAKSCEELVARMVVGL